MKLHHLGFACQDLGAAKAELKARWPALQAGPEVFDPGQDATLCLLTDPAGGPAYELVAGPAVAAVLKKGLAFYHLCYEVPDLERGVEALLADGYRVVREALPAPLFGGRRVVFVHGSLGLLELLEQA